MALKFADKLKNIDLSKTSDVVSSAKSSLSTLFQKSETTNEPDIDEQHQEANDKLKKLADSAHELQQKVAQYIFENGDKLKHWYSDHQINEKIEKVARKAGAIIIYPVLLLYNLMRSPMTPVKDKAVIVLPLAYFILPVDLIPYILVTAGGIGYVDDGAAIMASLNALKSSITTELQEATKLQCKDIVGEIDENVLEKVKSVLHDRQDTIVSSISSSKHDSDSNSKKH
jgi:uncharacterized membrane protein YkvA (DUF1232 family)